MSLVPTRQRSGTHGQGKYERSVLRQIQIAHGEGARGGQSQRKCKMQLCAISLFWAHVVTPPCMPLKNIRTPSCCGAVHWTKTSDNRCIRASCGISSTPTRSAFSIMSYVINIDYGHDLFIGSIFSGGAVLDSDVKIRRIHEGGQPTNTPTHTPGCFPLGTNFTSDGSIIHRRSIRAQQHHTSTKCV